MFKLIISFVLIFSLSSTEGHETPHTPQCTAIELFSFDIVDNPFVKPGRRNSTDVWYDTVTWERIPPGQIMFEDVIESYNQLKTWEPVTSLQGDLFNHAETTTGSMSNILRYALGIPRFSDPVLGQRQLDSLMFSVEPCTLIYNNYEWMIFPYRHIIRVVAKYQAKEIVIAQGILKNI